MDNRIEIKVEPDDEVEPYLGTYACLFCSDSVQGKPALKCASAGTAAPSTIIAAIIEDAVPAVSGAVAAPDGAGQGARGGRADAQSGGSGKGKEPAQAEAGPDPEAGGAATRGRAGAVQQRHTRQQGSESAGWRG